MSVHNLARVFAKFRPKCWTFQRWPLSYAVASSKIPEPWKAEDAHETFISQWIWDCWDVTLVCAVAVQVGLTSSPSKPKRRIGGTEYWWRVVVASHPGRFTCGENPKYPFSVGWVGLRAGLVVFWETKYPTHAGSRTPGLSADSLLQWLYIISCSVTKRSWSICVSFCLYLLDYN
jgi:hypothetical protein